jgi:hypothetical protein
LKPWHRSSACGRAPDTLYVAQNRTVLATALDGFVHEGPDHGLFVYQTRVLSRWRYIVNGEPPEPV